MGAVSQTERIGRWVNMPIVHYRCEDCGARFDAFVRGKGEAGAGSLACRECGSRRVKGMFSVIGEGGPERASPVLGCDDCGSCDAYATCGCRK